jgi:hypothetical protein
MNCQDRTQTKYCCRYDRCACEYMRRSNSQMYCSATCRRRSYLSNGPVRRRHNRSSRLSMRRLRANETSAKREARLRWWREVYYPANRRWLIEAARDRTLIRKRLL